MKNEDNFDPRDRGGRDDRHQTLSSARLLPSVLLVVGSCLHPHPCTMVVLSLDGRSMTAQAIAEALLRVKNEDSNDDQATDELILREVDLDTEQVALFIDMLRSKSISSCKWKSIHISHCSGLVNDAIMTCVSSTNIPNLFLQQSVINAQTTYCLTYGLKYNKELLSLKLSIPWDATTSRNLATSLARNFSLQELSLENSTNFDEPGVVRNLSFGLRLNQHLQSLNLDGCYLQDEQVSSILLALDGHSSILRLSLKHNSCHDQGMAAIASLLHANQLQELDMSFLVRPTKEQREQRQQQEEQKQEEEKEEEKVEEVQAVNDKTGDSDEVKAEEDAKPAARNDEEMEDNNEEPKHEDADGENDAEEETQVRNTSLRLLWLAGNFVGDEYLDSVMNVFGKESQLETLSLFGNRISSQGVQRLVLRKLPRLKNMKKLYLGNNARFDPLHIKGDLIDAARSNFSLEELIVKDLMETNPDVSDLQDLLTHYCRMNLSGRRIMACFEENNSKENTKTVPLGLWPLILERANRMHQEESEDVDQETIQKPSSYAADAIFCLLHGPVLYENSNLVPE